tara:strand:+ start:298 stop:705 length:408 start_codon:yes stop_codon:yes gene_type:complete
MKKKIFNKYSKSSNFYTEIKKDFFSENDRILQKALKINKLYSKQDKRTFCKLCNEKLNSESDFKKLGVEPVAQWRFGTDVMDLRRSIDVSLKISDASDYFRERTFKETQKYANDLQAVIDKAHNCFQIHILAKPL